uniref:Uncharacterized protein n=1 Tax=Arundo donax TaxID=35708 RepID=A0A0A9DHA6_ARUDO
MGSPRPVRRLAQRSHCRVPCRRLAARWGQLVPKLRPVPYSWDAGPHIWAPRSRCCAMDYASGRRPNLRDTANGHAVRPSYTGLAHGGSTSFPATTAAVAPHYSMAHHGEFIFSGVIVQWGLDLYTVNVSSN